MGGRALGDTAIRVRGSWPVNLTIVLGSVAVLAFGACHRSGGEQPTGHAGAGGFADRGGQGGSVPISAGAGGALGGAGGPLGGSDGGGAGGVGTAAGGTAGGVSVGGGGAGGTAHGGGGMAGGGSPAAGGGMAGGSPADGGVSLDASPGDGGAGDLGGRSCPATTARAVVPSNLPPDVLILFDRSGSMDEDLTGMVCAGGCGALSKWSIATAAVTSFLAMTESTVNWGLKLFASTGSSCLVSSTAEIV